MRQHLYCAGFALCVIASAIFISSALAQTKTSGDELTVSYAWKTVKIGGGGFVTGIVAHPTTPNLIYARTDVGGAYKWNETTRSWTQLLRIPNVLQPNIYSGRDYNVDAIALSRTDDQVVYVAAGSDYYDAGNPANTTRNGRILKSVDRGQTWDDVGRRWFVAGNGDWRTGGERLAVDPVNSNVVYFGSRIDGLWTSVDGGANWLQTPTSQIPVGLGFGTPAGVRLVIFDSSGGALNGKTRRIYVIVAGVGVYRTNDAGASWQQIKSLETWQVPEDAEIAADGTFYAALFNVIEKYNPVVGTWTNISPVPNQSYFKLAIDPFNSQRIFVAPGGVGDGYFYRSINGGASWETLNVALSAPTAPWITATDEENYLTSGNINFDPTVPNRMWFAQGMGVWRTSDVTDLETTWTFESDGIEELVPTDIIAPPGGSLVTAAYDRQGFFHENLEVSPLKTLVDAEFYGGTSLNWSGGNPNFLVHAGVKNNVGEPYGRAAFSGDGGRNWTVFPAQPANNTGGNIAVSATNTNNIVWQPSTANFGAGKIPYYTNNRGASWQPSAGINSTATHWLFWWGSKKILDADKVAANTYYLVTFDGNGEFYVSRDGGANFAKALNSPRCSLNEACHVWGQLRSVPGKANHVWSGDGLGGLFYTTDAGATAWTQIPNVTEAKAFGFGKPEFSGGYPTVYLYGKVGGDKALWRSTDQAVTWTKISVHPLGIYDEISVIAGDMNRFGRVYVAFGGNSFVYGDAQSAAVTVGGRVMTAAGRGVPSARITMINQNGVNQTTRSNSFGYYRFANVITNADYTFTVVQKRYIFVPQTVSVLNELSNLNFIAQ